MALQIRRGTDLQRSSQIFSSGELIYTTDQKQLWIGDSSTTGGTNVHAGAAGAGLTWNPGTNKLDLNPSTFNFTTNDLVEGSNSKFFTVDRAQDAVGTMLQNGVNTGITFSYNSTTNVMTATVTGAGMTTVSSDATPALGGNLNLSTHSITGTGNINITGTIAASVGLGGDLSLNSHNITGTGGINISGAITATSISTSLGSNLSLNNYNISGSGNVNINGYISNSTLKIDGSNILNPSEISSADPAFLSLASGEFVKIHPVGGVLEIKGVVNNSQPASNNLIQNYVLRGSIGSPAIVQPGDSLGGTSHVAHDGSNFVYTASAGFIVDPRFTPATNSIKSLYRLGFPDRNTPQDTTFYADNLGVFGVPVGLRFTPLNNPTARDAAFPAGTLYAGMMVFLSDTTGSGGPAGLQINTDGTSGGWKTISAS